MSAISLAICWRWNGAWNFASAMTLTRQLAAAVTGNAISGALLAALRVWGEAGGDDIDELRDYTSRALGLLLELPGVQ